ncbi:MAG TPA: hypothetical protein VLA21_07880 [Candidatus Limnocylindria bacterium]|nr:hypothetical protein [Candidatus Limnocylindria bacterium]
MKKAKGKKIMRIAAIVVVLLVVQTLPVFFVSPLGSRAMRGSAVTVHYQQKDEQGAAEVFELLEREGAALRASMGVESAGVTDVYIYHTQWQLAIREAGLATLIVAPAWHIGDSHNGNVMLVSPYTPVRVHTHDSILQAALHEYVHALVNRVNPRLSYFWDNGLATYLAGQKPDEAEFLQMRAPTITDMHTENGLAFGNMNGYAFSYKYIEYLDRAYGWDKVLEYASGKGGYEAVFGKTEKEIYDDWCLSINKFRS